MVLMRTEQPKLNVLYHFRNLGRGWRTKTCFSPPPPDGSLLTIPGRWFCFGLFCLFWCQRFGVVSPNVCLYFFWFGLGCWVAAFWERAANSGDHMFSLYFDCCVVFVVSRFGFLGWVWVLAASFPDICILFTSIIL